MAAAIFDLPSITISDSTHTSPTVLLDLENDDVSFGISLLSRIMGGGGNRGGTYFWGEEHAIQIAPPIFHLSHTFWSNTFFSVVLRKTLKYHIYSTYVIVCIVIVIRSFIHCTRSKMPGLLFQNLHIGTESEFCYIQINCNMQTMYQLSLWMKWIVYSIGLQRLQYNNYYYWYFIRTQSTYGNEHDIIIQSVYMHKDMSCRTAFGRPSSVVHLAFVQRYVFLARRIARQMQCSIST